MRRECNGCTMCCESAPVAEYGTAEWERCQNCTGDGCSIYPWRPETCRGFSCLWLEGELLNNWWPKASGVMVVMDGFEASRSMAPGVAPAYVVNVWAEKRARNLTSLAGTVHEIAQRRAGDALVQLQLNFAGERYVWDALLARWRPFPRGALIHLGYHQGDQLMFLGAEAGYSECTTRAVIQETDLCH